MCVITDYILQLLPPSAFLTTIQLLTAETSELVLTSVN